ncbi:hypothetical protein IFM89_026263 [Coptis chinensis]|uniref:Uncharacterized protein n=1 Tax=Coptis chinensis TaxID=261450 RepID=A0A835I6P7_9MAGN|nr:hypothetical protein IFM89_026263 [Coptis chinensis]
MQQAADLYEDLIKCCVADTMSEEHTLPSGTPLSSGLVLSQAKSLGKGVDTPSARVPPPFSLAVPSSSHLMDSVLADSTASNISRGSSQSSGLITSDLISAQVHASKDPRKFSYRSSLSTEPFVILYCQENF